MNFNFRSIIVILTITAVSFFCHSKAPHLNNIGKPFPSCKINKLKNANQCLITLTENLHRLEKIITVKILIIENLRSQTEVLKTNGKIFFFDKTHSNRKTNNLKISGFRHIELSFKAGRVIELRIFFHEQNYKSLYSIVRALYFSPGNLAGTMISGKKDTVEYANMSIQTKQFALKTIERSLDTVILQLDTFLENEKCKKNIQNQIEI